MQDQLGSQAIAHSVSDSRPRRQLEGHDQTNDVPPAAFPVRSQSCSSQCSGHSAAPVSRLANCSAPQLQLHLLRLLLPPLRLQLHQLRLHLLLPLN